MTTLAKIETVEVATVGQITRGLWEEARVHGDDHTVPRRETPEGVRRRSRYDHRKVHFQGLECRSGRRDSRLRELPRFAD